VPAPRKRRRALVVILLLLGLLGGGVWAGLHYLGFGSGGNETELAARALKAYEDRDFGEAATQFRRLFRTFPHSPKASEYRFLGELSAVREPIHRSQEPQELKPNLERLVQFVSEHKGDPRLKPRHPEVHDSFRRQADALLARAQKELDRDLLKSAAWAYDQLPRYGRPPSPQVLAQLAGAEQEIATKAGRQAVVAFIEKTLAKPSIAAIQQIPKRIAEANLESDPQVVKLWKRVPERLRAAVPYVPAAEEEAPDPAAEDRTPGLLITPALKKPHGDVRPGRNVILAQTRGVLHALEPDTGQVRWAVRVSPKGTHLPLRVPLTELAPEQVLVLSPDGLTLSALDAATGNTRWSRRLAMPCLGRPVLVDSRVLVPCSGGRVEEIESNDGSLRGRYELGQPLPLGGVRQPGTSLVCFPGDALCVYVLDVARHTCAAVLYTGHPAGSLLSTPLLLAGAPRPAGSGKSSSADGYLLLTQANGPDAMRLRAFALPAADPMTPPVQELPLDGRAGFAPWTDNDALALITDAGDLQVLGLEARANRGPPLSLRFRTRLLPGAGAQAGQARAQLVHGAEGRFWALAHGGLHRLQTAFTRAQGPHFEPPGPALLQPGSALHPAQVSREADGLVLYLVTQSPDGGACLATAVDGNGEVLWQRQLGLTCQGELEAVGGQVLAQDPAGRLFLFDPAKVPAQDGRAWCQGGRTVRERAPGAGESSSLLRGRDGTVYAVTVLQRALGAALRVLAIPPGKAPAAPLEIALEEPLAGRPAVVGDGLVVLLANGVPLWQPLSGKRALPGPNWRAELAAKDAVGYVVPLKENQFLMTDGNRGLRRMFCDGKVWEKRAEKELENRIVAPPAVLPAQGAEGEARVCVADSAWGVTLLRAEGLDVLRTWRLDRTITAGPFVRGGGIVCVLDRRRVVWLDPAKEAPLWVADFQADVVGRPRLIDGLLVVADQRGKIQGLDPGSGRPAGPGYLIQARAAPTASPVAFGADRFFVPLSDGTVLLPARSRLRPPSP
jgi:hypothetical protein